MVKPPCKGQCFKKNKVETVPKNPDCRCDDCKNPVCSCTKSPPKKQKRPCLCDNCQAKKNNCVCKEIIIDKPPSDIKISKKSIEITKPKTASKVDFTIPEIRPSIGKTKVLEKPIILKEKEQKKITPSTVTTAVKEKAAIIPVKEATIPDGAPTLPDEITTAPVEEAAAPVEEATAPDEEAIIPDEEAIIPDEEVIIPDEEAIIPDEEVIIPDEVTIIPDEEPTAPVEETAIPDEVTIIPDEEITAPVEEITAPIEEIAIPDEAIIIPDEEITAPVEEITAPVEELAIPDEAIIDEIPIADIPSPDKEPSIGDEEQIKALPEPAEKNINCSCKICRNKNCTCTGEQELGKLKSCRCQGTCHCKKCGAEDKKVAPKTENCTCSICANPDCAWKKPIELPKSVDALPKPTVELQISHEVPSKPTEEPRRPTEVSRKPVEAPRKPVEEPRRIIEAPRKSIETSCTNETCTATLAPTPIRKPCSATASIKQVSICVPPKACKIYEKPKCNARYIPVESIKNACNDTCLAPKRKSSTFLESDASSKQSLILCDCPICKCFACKDKSVKPFKKCSAKPCASIVDE